MPKIKSWENTKDGDRVSLVKERKYYSHENFFIQNGIIALDEVRIGQAVQELMHGYHPAIKVKVKGKVKWFEQDEPQLYYKIMQFAKEEIC